jgi:transcriptional regulator with XRE-family HTH domain
VREQNAVTREVVGRIRKLRKERKVSAQKLADRCQDLGFQVPRMVIANLESGRRDSITVDELATLASALQVPVAGLLMTRCQSCYDNPPAGFTCNACGHTQAAHGITSSCAP